MLLLIVFGGHSYAQTKPRKFGIGLTYRWADDQSKFKGTASGDGNTYMSDVEGSIQMNDEGKLQFPLFLQFDEDLINNFLFTQRFIEFTVLDRKNLPPKLRGISYSSLVESDIYEVQTDITYTDTFSKFYPQYSEIIDNSTNPSLSADYYITKIAVGQSWGIFYPTNDRNRLFTIGFGLGLNYIEGNYSINLCDPYTFSQDKTQATNLQGDFRASYCLNKKELYSSKINHFSVETNIIFKLYSYIGDKIEINLMEANIYESIPSLDLTTDSSVLKPVFTNGHGNWISLVYIF